MENLCYLTQKCPLLSEYAHFSRGKNVESGATCRVGYILDPYSA